MVRANALPKKPWVLGAQKPPKLGVVNLNPNLAFKSPQQRRLQCARLIPSKGWFNGALGEREVRNSKGFRCRLAFLATRLQRGIQNAWSSRLR